ncbi:MAG: hypothetical protein U0522_00785 [Candidatus Paceibacterota bacterium]
MNNKKEIIKNIKIVLLTCVFYFGSVTVFGWSAPSSPPPDCANNFTPGCRPPINLGTVGQIKQGGLTVGAAVLQDDLGFSAYAGKVGIGTDAPTQMLDVVGYSKSRTGFCIGDACITQWPTNSGGVVINAPSGAVMSFNLSSCPSGWSPFTDGAGRVILGVGNSNTGSGSTASTNHTLGQKGGQEAIVQTLEQMASHNHTINNNGNYLVNAFGNTGKNYCSGGTCQQNVDIPWDNPNTSSPSIGATGNAEAMNMLNPYIALLYCVKN